MSDTLEHECLRVYPRRFWMGILYRYEARAKPVLRRVRDQLRRPYRWVLRRWNQSAEVIGLGWAGHSDRDLEQGKPGATTVD